MERILIEGWIIVLSFENDQREPAIFIATNEWVDILNEFRALVYSLIRKMFINWILVFSFVIIYYRRNNRISSRLVSWNLLKSDKTVFIYARLLPIFFFIFIFCCVVCWKIYKLAQGIRWPIFFFLIPWQLNLNCKNSYSSDNDDSKTI